jgi:hypothetical protein
MKKQIESLMNTFASQLLKIEPDPVELNKLNAVTILSENTILEIREILTAYRFENDEQEIDFFRNINPKILFPPIEEGLKYNIRINKPISTNEVLVDYFESVLKTLQSFFSMNSFHYQYFKNGFTEMDHMFFLRNAGPLSLPILEIPAQIKVFCPPMSYLFAKFFAYEHVQHYILEQISGLKIAGVIGSLQSHAEHTQEIKWTGDVINLTELAYGLWLTGQLNNGNASLNQIVRWLENNLSVSIGIAQRKFSEISRRKRISVTKFIDQMRDAVHKKIEKDYE